ncbi:MAG: hypothetical protein ACI4I8_03385, partial [Oscillospiraceae bacterium]
FRVTGFQDQLLKPLGHLSIRDGDYFIITKKQSQGSCKKSRFFSENTASFSPSFFLILQKKI